MSDIEKHKPQPLIKYETLKHTAPLVRESSGEVWMRMFNRAIKEMKANMPEPGHATKIQLIDGPGVSSDIPNRILSQWREAVIGVKDKEVHELNDMEKFCIAYFSGVEIEFHSDRQLHPLDPRNTAEGPRLRWKTKNKVGLVKDGGKFFCYESPS